MRNIKLLYIFSFMRRFRLYEAFAIVYYADIANSYTLGMSVFAIHAFSTALLEVPTGILSDKIGRKKTLILSTVFYTISTLIFALAQDYIHLVFGAVFVALGYSTISGTDNAFIFEILKKEKKQQMYHQYKGTYDALSKGALCLSAMMGGGLVLFLPIRALYFITCVTTALSVITLFPLEDIQQKTVSKRSVGTYLHYLSALRKIRRNIKLKNLTFAQIISMGIGNATWRFRASFVKVFWPLWAIGVLETASQIFSVIGFHWGHKIIDRWGHKKPIIGHELTNTLAIAAAFLSNSILSPALLAIANLTYPYKTLAMDHLFQKSFDNQKRATMGSIVSFGGNLLYAIFAVIMGGVADLYGVPTAILIAGFTQLSALVFYQRAFKDHMV